MNESGYAWQRQLVVGKLYGLQSGIHVVMTNFGPFSPCFSVVVAWLDQAAGSQTMQRIGWAQPEAISGGDGAPLQQCH